MDHQHKQLLNAKFLVMLMQFGSWVASEPQVPAFFIFGDSYYDNGNNNDLATGPKANFLPYGIDFPQGATGRFTDNRTRADVIGQLLGFDEFIPPYANATDQQIQRGVNYASAGAGIRDESGILLGNRISFNRQIENHRMIVQRLSLSEQNVTILRKSIYAINIGTNDYINNYFMPTLGTGQAYNFSQYADVLITQFSRQLKTLYDLDARKIVIFGLGQIGCTPVTIALFGTGGKPCNDTLNDAVNIFNDRLKPLVDDLNNNLVGANFTFINITSITSPDPPPRGVDAPCCQVGPMGICIEGSLPCADRDSTTFYDGFHPTDVANVAVATRSYNALSLMDTYPIDISHLAQL